MSSSDEQFASSSPTATSYCQVLIIGAGVSGLQCANTLTGRRSGSSKQASVGNDDGCFDMKDILLLEARNRVGGRVNTRQHKVTSKRGNDEDDESGVLWIDDGAAWVHGVDAIPWPNDNEQASKDNIPFYSVNQQQKLENPVLEHLDRHTELNEIAGPGNPWTRPYSILHQTQNLALYIPNADKPLMFHGGGGKAVKRNNRLIQASIRRHFDILRRVDHQADQMYKTGRGIEAYTSVTLWSAIKHWNENVPVDKRFENDEQSIRSMAAFYQHMLTCWQGLSLDEIPIGHFGGCDDDDDDDDDDSDDDSEDDRLYDDNEFEQDGDFSGFHCTVKGGMQKVVQGLMSPELEERIRLEQEVIRVEHVHKEDMDVHDNEEKCKGTEDRPPYRIRVETKDGSIIYAKACVMTIPVGCLRENHRRLFAGTTPLSPEKVEAFETLTMGRYKKVFLTFDSIFWPAEPAFLGMSIEQHDANDQNPLGTSLFIDNLWAKDGNPCMEAILAGDQGLWATNKSDDDIRETVLDFLEKAMNHNNLQSRCLDCHVTRWEEDPYSRGAYAALSMGGLQRHTDAMVTPEWDGCLHFAGDVCSTEFEGSVSAAMFSGRHVGRKIARRFGKQSTKATMVGKTLEEREAPSNINYEDYDWRELPNHVQQAAAQLGYSKRMWNRDLEPPSADLDWDDLSPDQQRSASIIGFNKDTWDSN